MNAILVIEDDSDIALSVKYNLERTGEFSVITASDGESGLRLARESSPDLVILDLNLPGMDGLEVCRQLHRVDANRPTPVIMLTARADEAQRIEGLDLGADDYVTKPFSVRELLSRIRAVLRRATPTGEGGGDGRVLRAAEIVVDLEGRTVHVGGERTSELTRKEFDLLAALIRNRGRVLTRDRLLEEVWGYDYPGETRTVDVHVRRLRQKLGDAGKDNIETVVGVGYRFRNAP
jgi:DNA-binding response OmpR family regulator